MLNNIRELQDEEGRVIGELFERLPTRKTLPEYYRQIAQPIDFESIAKCLKQGGYHTIWKFLLAVELMLSNCQAYNEEDSMLYDDANTLREAINSELQKTYPGHPYPKPFSIYDEASCQMPEWEPAKAGKKGGGKKLASSFKVTLKMSDDKVKAAAAADVKKGAGGLKIPMKDGVRYGKGSRSHGSSGEDQHEGGEETEEKPQPMPVFRLRECAHCGADGRGRRCYDVQMKEAGHEGCEDRCSGAKAWAPPWRCFGTTTMSSTREDHG